MPTFERSLVYSLVFHFLLVLILFGYTKFNGVMWKKPPPVASVVWTQTVKRPTQTIPDKLPPPLVPLKKSEPPKAEEINIKKKQEPTPPKKEETRDEKMKKALEKLKQNVKDDDDRPAPKEDNFPTAKEQPEGTLSDTEILALQSSSIYGTYIKQLQDEFLSNFLWFKSEPQLETLISMTIDPQGNISNIKIEKSSGDIARDQAALRAVIKSNPVTPPPAELVPMFLQQAVTLRMNPGK